MDREETTKAGHSEMGEVKNGMGGEAERGVAAALDVAPTPVHWERGAVSVRT